MTFFSRRRGIFYVCNKDHFPCFVEAYAVAMFIQDNLQGPGAIEHRSYYIGCSASQIIAGRLYKKHLSSCEAHTTALLKLQVVQVSGREYVLPRLAPTLERLSTNITVIAQA